MSDPPTDPPDQFRSTSANHAVHLDLVSTTIGWRFHLSGAVYGSGWRPTRKWAKGAGRRQMKALNR